MHVESEGGWGQELWVQILALLFIIVLQPVGSQLGSLSLCPQLKMGIITFGVVVEIKTHIKCYSTVPGTQCSVNGS